MDGCRPAFVYCIAMKYVVRLLLLSVFVAVVALSCDKATPTAPSGSTLAISANPSRIGLNGSSTITISGREPNGSPMRDGTEIRLSSSLGTIDPLVTIGRDGNATATLRGDGRRGAANVTAQTGTSSGGSGGGGGGGGSSAGSLSVGTTVQIGESDDTKPTIIVSANPTVVPVEGTSTITVIGRNIDGSPVSSGQEVLLTTTLGSLQPRRPTTNSSGIATSTLSAGNQPGIAKISAVLGTSDVGTVDIEIKDATLTLTANPSSIDEEGGTIELSAVVTNFQGGPVSGKQVTFSAQRGRLNRSTDTTDANGVATATLTIEPISLNSDITFTATATTPSGSGEPLTSTVTITIRDTE